MTFNTTKYEPGIRDSTVKRFLEDDNSEIVSFSKIKIKEKFRDD